MLEWVKVMLHETGYRRAPAIEYAHRWAYSRNPAYANFDRMGGDCTNFASQCLFAGCGVMNETKTFGWYYHSLASRAPGWTSVVYLHQFLTTNKSVGPYARECTLDEVVPGDIVQLGDESGNFYHSPFVVAVNADGILVAAHTYDTDMRPLSSYIYGQVRFLHIEGCRSW